MKLLHLKKEKFQLGSVDRSYLNSVVSKVCGLQKKNMKNMERGLFTGNVIEIKTNNLMNFYIIIILFIILFGDLWIEGIFLFIVAIIFIFRTVTYYLKYLVYLIQ